MTVGNAPFVVDSSAILAVFMNEPEARCFQAVIAKGACFVASPTLVEIWTSLIRKTGDAILAGEFARGIAQGLEVVPFTRDHADVAGEAYGRFGKGRHPAKLNYGDCMAYAAAKIAGLPLLFKGADFGQTDIDVHADSSVFS